MTHSDVFLEGTLHALQGKLGTRTANAYALTFVELYSLSRECFEKVAAHYPEVLDLFYFIAEARHAINEGRSLNTEMLAKGVRQ